MDLSTSHISSYKTPEVVSGRLIFRSGNFLGLYTKGGPVTMSMPDNFYHLSSANDRYKGNVEKRIPSQSSSPAEECRPDC